MYKKINRTFTLATIPLLLLITGCSSLQPEYVKSTNIVPQEFPQHGIYAQNKISDKNNQSELVWTNYVLDDNLKKVVELSLANNKDLRIALANIKASQAQYGISQTERFPMLNANISGNKSETNNVTTENYQASIGISSFELDFFGRVSSLNSAALESFLATTEAKRATELSIISETLKAYFNVGLEQNYLTIAQKTEQATLESLEIIKDRVKYGVSTAKDLSDLESIYYLSKADVLKYQTQVEKSKNALNALVGQTVDEKLMPSTIKGLVDTIKDLDIALSSETLFNRPDVLSAEHQLLASNANIGAARAAFFPRVSLTTSAGVLSGELSNLFSNNLRTWSFAPTISIPIFDYAKNKANLEFSKAQNEKQLAMYEKTVQTAFKEVADNLARKATIDEQIDAYKNYIKSNQTSFDLASIMYDAGVKDYLSVLTARNALYSAEKTALNLVQEKFNNKVEIYKTIGF